MKVNQVSVMSELSLFSCCGIGDDKMLAYNNEPKPNLRVQAKTD